MKRIKTLLRILKLILEIVLWIPICFVLYLITLIFISLGYFSLFIYKSTSPSNSTVGGSFLGWITNLNITLSEVESLSDTLIATSVSPLKSGSNELILIIAFTWLKSSCV